MDTGYAGERAVPMGRDPVLRTGNGARQGRAPARQMADVVIDRWLQASLGDRFDAVIAEPIPDALAEAVRRLGNADDAGLPPPSSP
jgi:hypothetical protein